MNPLENNPTIELMRRRRSVRAYLPEPLKPEEKEAILQAALRAPTAGNLMLYSIIEVTRQEDRDQLAVICDHQPFIAKAPWVLLFLADYQRMVDYFQLCRAGERCRELGQEPRRPQAGDLMLASCDALIAAQTAVLAAEALGIGSCYIGDIMENCETTRELFQLPPLTFPIALVCFGRPTAEQAARPQPARFASENIIFQDSYRRLEPAELEKMWQPHAAKQFPAGSYPNGAQNMGQHMFFKKFNAEFSWEMSRSVREYLKSWE